MLALMLLACQPANDDARAYPEALAAVQTRPEGAVGYCQSVQAPALRADCVSAGAEALARKQAARAAELCATIDDGLGRDECLFQVAERAREPARCADAGRFADDCRLHLWSSALEGRVARDAAPGQIEVEAKVWLEEFGFSAEDDRPWSALYRTILSRARPLDRDACDLAPEPRLVDACRHTAISVYQDRLNMARDRGIFPCDGGDLPALLQITPDPELEAILAARRGQDLCP